jgi:hypothetical protein
MTECIFHSFGDNLVQERWKAVTEFVSPPTPTIPIPSFRWSQRGPCAIPTFLFPRTPKNLPVQLADIGQFTERLDAKLLLVVDVAGGGVQLVVAK